MSISAACLAFRISQACYRYEAKHQAENDEIADWLLRLTDNNRPDGHPKLLHLWPVKLLQAGRSDGDYTGVTAMREAASFKR